MGDSVNCAVRGQETPAVSRRGNSNELTLLCSLLIQRLSHCQWLKSTPEHFMRRGDDDERIRIGGANQRFELSHLRHGDGDHQHFVLLL